MEKLTGFALALILAGAASAAQAKPVEYECHFTNRMPGSGVTDPLFIRYDAATGKALAWDGAIKLTTGKPKPVTVTTDNDQRLSLRWQVAGLPGTENRLSTKVTLSYGATIIKSTLRIFAYTQFNGADNSFSASGNCTIRP